ncbi:uncharacterized protein DSM5745_04471 [Aspergillus mulundensis]|uniref:Uncharacterized protein n=1 Tax=Aspergillus mulundensis TaxID=1810919 RepID=A0A3D8SCS4_9EURO|nr:hypothetical protein DSM5745_04471 [Aspergillus mulundensis]RDW84145.1 hypothetical protein DSM5745_04471 [Aspergillus mulundensis]
MAINLSLPSTIELWKKRVEELGIQNLSLHTSKHTSASGIQERQYLLMRVLWIEVKGKAFDWDLSGLKEWQEEADDRLSKYNSWRTYRESLRSPQIPESSFAVAQLCQRQAEGIRSEDMRPSVAVTPVKHRYNTRLNPTDPEFAKGQPPLKGFRERLQDMKISATTPQTPTGKLLEDEYDDGPPDTEPSPYTVVSPGEPELQSLMWPPTKDEQIVNAALVNYLIALTVHTGLPLEWSFHRIALKADFEHTSYEARTDGYLEVVSGSMSSNNEEKRVRALIEVKAARRYKKPNPICMQEAAQAVAWLKSYPDHGGLLNTRGRRIHVSQDRHEIFIIVAEYDEAYLAFLRDEKESPDAFMRMRQYGPWNTLDRTDMERVTPILLAIALRANADCQAEFFSTDSTLE